MPGEKPFESEPQQFDPDIDPDGFRQEVQGTTSEEELKEVLKKWGRSLDPGKTIYSDTVVGKKVADLTRELRDKMERGG